MPLDADLGRLVRRYVAGLDRDPGPGAVVPDTTGNQAVPVADTARGQVDIRLLNGRTDSAPDLDDRGPAYRGAPNDFAWRLQTRAEIATYRESYLDFGTAGVGATATLDPNVSTNFILRASGNVTVAVGAPDAPPDLDALAPSPQFLLGLKIWLYRPKGAVVTWSNVKWSKDVTNPAGDGSKPSLLAAAAADGWDSYVLVVVPGTATFGYLSGRGYPA